MTTAQRPKHLSGSVSTGEMATGSYTTSRLADRLSGLTISLGESINVPTNGIGAPLAPGRHGHSRSVSEPLPFVTKLAPAVSTVPQEDVRAYLHTKRVENYLVGSTLGEGSFAKVKEAFHVRVGEKVAMKVIDKKQALKDDYVNKNFRREAKLLGRVNHPNILQLFEVIETENSYYIITELCSGGELMKHIYTKGRLDEDETRKFMRQIVSAIDHLHRAGIIHRDLKVENLLLDSNMDLKLIDFGLSNEEFIEGDSGRVHCSTQCGSPAYAAPELLGHKDYGPEVDIWSIGVNMYAMLTGCLPYTVEPFNITTLHAKMLENKMNPVPEKLSADCKDLLRQLLTSNKEERIKMPAIMTHPWMNKGYRVPFGPAPYPNTCTENDLNEDIIEHMVHVLKLADGEEAIKRELIANQPTPSSAVYHLLVARLARYQKQYSRPKVTRTRQRSRHHLQDQESDDETKSIISCPTAKKSMNKHRIHLRKTSRSNSKERRPISDPSLDEPKTRNPEYTNGRRERRRTLPPTVLEEQLAPFQHNSGVPTAKKIAATLPHQAKSVGSHLDRYCHYRDFDEPGVPRAETRLAPVRPPPNSYLRNSHSQPQALNQLKHELKYHIPAADTNAKSAWSSQPSSRVSSRNPSRAGSRNPSTVVSRESSNSSLAYHAAPNPYHQRQPDYVNVEDIDEVKFHPAEAYTIAEVGTHTSTRVKKGKPASFYLKGDSPEGDSSHEIHFPTIPQTPAKKTRKSSDQTGLTSGYPHRNDYLSPSTDFEGRTDLPIDRIMSEILRVAKDMKVREVSTIGHRVTCMWRGIRTEISVHKESRTKVCRLSFRQLGGDQSNGDFSQHIISNIRL